MITILFAQGVPWYSLLGINKDRKCYQEENFKNHRGENWAKKWKSGPIYNFEMRLWLAFLRCDMGENITVTNESHKSYFSKTDVWNKGNCYLLIKSYHDGGQLCVWTMTTSTFITHIKRGLKLSFKTISESQAPIWAQKPPGTRWEDQSKQPTPERYLWHLSSSGSVLNSLTHSFR